MPHDLGLTGIERVTFAASDVAEACRFADDWGLVRCSDGAVFTTTDGCEVELVDGDDGLRSVTWGVHDASCLDALRHELGSDRPVHVDAGGALRTTDDLGFDLAFRPTQRVLFAYEPTRYNTPGRPARVDERGVRYDRARPHEISHLAIAVDDAGAASRFYIERLGFRVSDRYADRGVFLRCSPAGNHHHLFLLNGVRPGTHFGHLAFKVRDVHEVISGGQAFAARGWRTFAGPGRHRVSSACFWYFHTPFGGSWEYAADEDVVTEAWPATDFAAEAHIFSEWTFELEASDGRLRGPISESRAVEEQRV